MVLARLTRRSPDSGAAHGVSSSGRTARLTQGAWVVAAALALAACGGDDSGAVASTVSPSTSSPQTPPAATPLAITSTTPSSYTWDALAVGKPIHIDDAEQLTAVPGKYKGLRYLRTASADRFVGTATAVTFQVNRAVTVLVAYDASSATLPQWLRSWTDTGDALTTGARRYKLLRKSFPSGPVSLGGNELGVSTYALVVDDGTAFGNAPPSITGNPPSSISANRVYEFVPAATDVDGDRLVFTASNLPSWATLDAATGRISGTPPRALSTYANIELSVSDGDSSASLPPFSITVTPTGTNSPPSISSPTVPTGTQYEPYRFQPTASDPDGDRLSFSVANRPRWASFDSTTGALVGTPGRGDAGTDPNVIITVSDGSETATLPPFTIRVYAPGEVPQSAPSSPSDPSDPSPVNSAPTIFGTPATTALQGTQYSFTAFASDADGDALTFSIANRPSWATFSNTGRLSGTPGATHIGTYGNILISVTDGQTVTALPTFSIVVTPTGTNVPPVISGNPATSITQGQAYAFTPTASDPNGDALTFSIGGRPSWATFDAGTGRLSGTPGASHVGTHGNITISVSDGQRNATLGPFSITVNSSAPANRAPVISGTPVTQVLAGSSYSFTPAASDLDGNALTFTITNRPAWASFSSTTGRLSGTPTAADVGTTSGVVIRVSDGQATASLAAFNVTVTAVATGSATLSWTPPTQNTDGSALTNLAGYRVYWGRSAGSYTASTTLNNPGLSSYVVDQLTSGTWYFVATAVNAQGVESSFSNPASKTIQ